MFVVVYISCVILEIPRSYPTHKHPEAPTVNISVYITPPHLRSVVIDCVRHVWNPALGDFEAVDLLSIREDCWSELRCAHCQSVIAHVHASCVADCSLAAIEERLRELNAREE